MARSPPTTSVKRQGSFPRQSRRLHEGRIRRGNNKGCYEERARRRPLCPHSDAQQRPEEEQKSEVRRKSGDEVASRIPATDRSFPTTNCRLYYRPVSKGAGFFGRCTGTLLLWAAADQPLVQAALVRQASLRRACRPGEPGPTVSRRSFRVSDIVAFNTRHPKLPMTTPPLWGNQERSPYDTPVKAVAR
jgi:hypothetical protein